ncbi:MAG: signal peptide peptidase SppA, partial [Caldilineaceae bacterium]|nr:signal peptide peptidase SppA [Caldilineaceae bacterium]
SVEEVATLINGAPWDAEQALAHGLVDNIAYEDELPTLLGTEETPAQLQPYDKVRGLLLRRPRSTPAQSIGVLSLQGSIMPGESQSQPFELPILGRQTLGSSTAQQQIRAARHDESLAAVVVYVDSPGGSALASDLIWRELRLLQREKPVVVYMGNVAASGGYYIAMGAQQIIAQRATLTGSIGVITGKAVTAGTYAKLDANRQVIQRGTHAGLYADDHHWTGSEREKVEESVVYVYEVFKSRVADGRNLPYPTLDAIANGRVWTGAQALEHGLVDELGDFQRAVEHACTLAELPTDGTVQTQAISTPKRSLLAEPIMAVQQAFGLDKVQQWNQFANLVVTEQWQTLFHGERFWFLVDGLPRIK